MRPARVFVYGSCVARDTFEYLDRDRFSLLEYVARQSLISAFSRPSGGPRLENEISPFQQRMLRSDFSSNLPALLTGLDQTPDLILWDLTDERLGVYRADDGAVITRSVDLMAAGADEACRASWTHLPLGSDEHYEEWCRASGRFVGLVAAMLPAPLLLLLEVPWALTSDDRSTVPTSFGVTSAAANQAFRRYHQHAREVLGVTSVNLPLQHAVAAGSHQWGPAPFHYTTGTYERLAADIDRHSLQLLDFRRRGR